MKNIIKTEKYNLQFKNGESREVLYEIYIDHFGDPKKNAEYFKENYSLKYLKYLRKDKHKYEANFAIKQNLIGFSYVVARDALTNEVIGFCACDIYSSKRKGKDIIASGTHCLCSLPKINESLDYLGGRGCNLASLTIKTLYDTVFKEFNIDVDLEICNEISNKAYTVNQKEGERWVETGVFRINKAGERCMIRSERWFK